MFSILRLSSFIFILFLNASFAQVKFGLKGAMQLTNVVDIHDYSKSRLGFHVGGFLYVPIGDDEQFVFQPELLLMQHGEGNKVLTNDIEKYFINYVALPLMLKYYFNDEASFYIEGGPQLAYEIFKESTPRLPEDHFYVKTNKFDFSFGLGGGYSFDRNVEIGVRYNYGFVDIYPDYENEKSNVTSNLSFYFSYIFD